MTGKSSLIYSNPILYQLVMRFLYGSHFEDRYRALSEEIPGEASVIDLCCGDCYLYLHYLKQKKVNYLGLDLSPKLVAWAKARGIQACLFDVWKDPIPPADIIIMQASLYHFLPHADQVVGRMLASARQKVLISEPIQNLSSSPNPLLAAIGRLATHPGPKSQPYSGHRFDQQSLIELFSATQTLSRYFYIPGGREMVGVFHPTSSHR